MTKTGANTSGPTPAPHLWVKSGLIQFRQRYSTIAILSEEPPGQRVSGKPFHITLIPIWNTHRNTVLAFGHAMHEGLPQGEPAITIHGRELQPENEGVGFQFQFTMNGNLYGGRSKSAYYVVQAQLAKRTTSIAWAVDAMPVIEHRDGQYDFFERQSYTVPLHDRRRLQALFLEQLLPDATAFFETVRRGDSVVGERSPLAGPGAAQR
jgi:hypothetical protein